MTAPNASHLQFVTAVPADHDPAKPSTDDVAAALVANPGQYAIVARHDRAARAQSMADSINGGRYFGSGFTAEYRQVGSEHRVYAACTATR